MRVPTFRFVAWSDGRPTVDAQFWRDADASDRLASRSAANAYLRELCRTRAREDASGAAETDPTLCRLHERALLREMLARGYRVFGPDLDALADPGRHAADAALPEAGRCAPAPDTRPTDLSDAQCEIRAARA